MAENNGNHTQLTIGYAFASLRDSDIAMSCSIVSKIICRWRRYAESYLAGRFT